MTRKRYNVRLRLAATVVAAVLSLSGCTFQEMDRMSRKAQAIRDKNDLLNKPCLNVQIGTWILAKHFQVCGVSWNCLGSYNAGFRADRHETRERYANRIWKIYQQQTGAQ